MKTFKKDFQRIEGRIAPLILDYILPKHLQELYRLKLLFNHR